MPKVVRCCICGRVADIPHDAMPYSSGVACSSCYVSRVKPSKKWKKDKHNYYENNRR